MNTIKDISDYLDKNITSIVSTSIVDLEINIKPSNEVKMVLQCPEMYMHRVRPYISKGVLTINTEGSFSLDSPLVVKVYLKTLEEINISGSGNVKGYFKGESLKIKSSGISDIELQGEVDSLDVVVSGTGNAKLRGLEAKKLNLNLSGVSNAQVNVEKHCSVKISGVGSATVFGDPEVLKESVSGLGKVKKGGKIKPVNSKKENDSDLRKNKFYDVSKKDYVNTYNEPADKPLNDLIAQLKDIKEKNKMTYQQDMDFMKNKLQKELDTKYHQIEIEKYNEAKHTEPTPAELKISKSQALSKKIKSML